MVRFQSFIFECDLFGLFPVKGDKSTFFFGFISLWSLQILLPIIIIIETKRRRRTQKNILSVGCAFKDLTLQSNNAKSCV